MPAQLPEWTPTHIPSAFAFLLGLNLSLLVVGCLMDILSASVVVGPLGFIVFFVPSWFDVPASWLCCWYWSPGSMSVLGS